MEDVRQREFSRLPSRMDAAYFFDDIDEARFYASSDGSRLMMLLYEVELVDPNARIHATDWRNTVPDDRFSLDWIRGYWSGEMKPRLDNGPSCRELLAVTPLRIIQQMPR